MDLERKLDLALAAPVEECVTREDLKELFETNEKPRHYIGFEISGMLHIPALFVAGKVINNLAAAGVETTVFLADWHSLINNKMGGDWEKITRAAEYFREAFQFHCPKVKIVKGSDLYHDNDGYWMDVIRFSKNVTLARDARCLAIMGRSESDKLDVSQYLYPPMQAVDIRALGCDIAHAGMDQRKVHMLAREVYPKMGWKKPIALHHHLLPGLGQPVSGGMDEDKKLDQVISSKMSKSKPDSAVFIHDSLDELKRKLSKAYCPAGVEGNPVLEFAEYVCFAYSDVLSVKRPAKFGGDVSFASYAELEAAFLSGKLHAMDLKNGVAECLDAMVAPVRRHFEQEKELLDVFKEAKATG